ncbi:DUF4176 domain-containing protein [Tumebacillus flagellatus]|uniref:DUF4176 domain-containing protein n=1 Tax=Tumebacillus flagellatus TaxID=1157490 RepID=A0A074LX28_9BACL|nr:DUF4176 domain-containing protein [Tumebacillus flagellatus]KEO84593.1 hypothetical protein EL26_03490 [Tumebacillus flagellatus]
MTQQLETDYLPLGTLVRLHRGTKRLMIYGRCLNKEETGEQFDYVGVPYPEGFINPEKTFVFNHSAIEEIVHLGFTDEEEVIAQELLQRHRKIVLEVPAE